MLDQNHPPSTTTNLNRSLGQYPHEQDYGKLWFTILISKATGTVCRRALWTVSRKKSDGSHVQMTFRTRTPASTKRAGGRKRPDVLPTRISTGQTKIRATCHHQHDGRLPARYRKRKTTGSVNSTLTASPLVRSRNASSITTRRRQAGHRNPSKITPAKPCSKRECASR